MHKHFELQNKQQKYRKNIDKDNYVPVKHRIKKALKEEREDNLKKYLEERFERSRTNRKQLYDQYKNEIREIESKLSSYPNEYWRLSDEDKKERARLNLRLKNILKEIPESIYKTIKKDLSIEKQNVFDYALAVKEMQEVQELFFTTIIYKFKKFLDQIYEEKEKLPKFVIFPDTSARPFYYLFKDILQKEYKEKNISYPYVLFVKTLRDIDIKLESLQKSLQKEKVGIEQNLKKAEKKYKELLKKYKKLKRKKEREKMDVSLTELFNEIKELKDNLISKNNEIQNYKQSLILEKDDFFLKKRFEAFKDKLEGQDCLIIDDFWVTGETITLIQKILKDYNVGETYSFTLFLAGGETQLLQYSNFNFGISSYTEKDENKILFSDALADLREGVDDEKIFRNIDNYRLLSFPYRISKKKNKYLSTVKKLDSNPYSESLKKNERERNLSILLRKRYRRLGKNAVKYLENKNLI